MIFQDPALDQYLWCLRSAPPVGCFTTQHTTQCRKLKNQKQADFKMHMIFDSGGGGCRLFNEEKGHNAMMSENTDTPGIGKDNSSYTNTQT